MTTLAIPSPGPLQRILTSNSIPEAKGLELLNTFGPFFATAAELAAESESIKVTDASQKAEIEKAKALRLRVMRLRTTAEKARKALKDESLRLGKAYDGANGLLLEKILPVEAALIAQEQFAERQEAYRKGNLRARREEALRPYVADVSVFALADMTDGAWDQLLEGSKLAHQKRIDDAANAAEAARVAEEKRLAEVATAQAEIDRLRKEQEARDRNARLEQELAEALREERAPLLAPFVADTSAYALGTMTEEAWVDLLNKSRYDHAQRQKERLKAEAAEIEARRERSRLEQEAAADRVRQEAEGRAMEAQFRAEQAAAQKERDEEKAIADAALAKERAAREKAEQEAAKIKLEQARKAKEEAAAKRKAERAPDAEKLMAFYNAICLVPRPEMRTEAGIAAMQRIMAPGRWPLQAILDEVKKLEAAE